MGEAWQTCAGKLIWLQGRGWTRAGGSARTGRSERDLLGTFGHSLVHIFIHSFIQQFPIECLSCAKYCPVLRTAEGRQQRLMPGEGACPGPDGSAHNAQAELGRKRPGGSWEPRWQEWKWAGPPGSASSPCPGGLALAHQTAATLSISQSPKEKSLSCRGWAGSLLLPCQP